MFKSSRWLFFSIMCSILFLTITNVTFADDNRRDGNHWLLQNKVNKLYYMVGFFDGIVLGRSFSMWGLPLKDGQYDTELMRVVTNGFDSLTDKYLSNVVVSQLVDGLDVFYSDYRNRSILINDAVWLVLQEISGTPKDKMTEIIESWRKNAQIK